MNNPLISVIVPIYMVEAYLPDCLDSILSQTYSHLEVILVDDGSRDSCPAICDAYQAQDSRVRVLHRQNGGVSAARNAGLTMATGEYIAFMDGDDRLSPGMYATLYALISSEQAAIAMCNFYWWRETGIVANQLPQRWPEEGTAVGAQAYPYIFSPGSYDGYVWNKLYHRSLLTGENAHPFLEGLALCEDRLFMAQLLPKAQSMVFTSSAQYYYRIKPKLASVDSGEQPTKYSLIARKQILEILPVAYAAYDKAIYLRGLARCTRDAYGSGDKEGFAVLRADLRRALGLYGGDFWAHKGNFPLRDHILLTLMQWNCTLGCALFSLPRRFRPMKPS